MSDTTNEVTQPTPTDALRKVELRLVERKPVDPLFERTEDQLAKEFADTYGEKLRFDHTRNTWFIWDGHRWKPDTDGLAYRLALRLAKARWNRAFNIPEPKEQKSAVSWARRSRTFRTLEGTLRSASKVEPVADEGTNWDRNPWLLGVRDGVVDLKTGSRRAGLPEDRITKVSPVSFGPTAECPRWMQFLGEVFLEDQALIDYVHKAVGYTLTGDTREQCFFLCYGGGQNGKSKFTKILSSLLGRELTTTLDFDSLSLTDRPKYELADVEGARLVLAQENERRVELSSKIVKQLTGGDLISARQIRERTRRFEPIAKIWLATNHKPIIRDMTEGMWRRIKEIPFNARFVIGKNADQGLEEKLLAELSGILNWALTGCIKWQQEGLEPPKAVLDAVQEYREESDKALAFIKGKCIFDPTFRVSAADLQAAYNNWLNANPNAPPYDALTASLRGRSCVCKNVRMDAKQVKVWHGVALAKQ